MQHGETGAPLPRNVARQRGRELCKAHNTEVKKSTKWMDARTGRSQDTTGTFKVVRKPAKKRYSKPLK